MHEKRTLNMNGVSSKCQLDLTQSILRSLIIIKNIHEHFIIIYCNFYCTVKNYNNNLIIIIISRVRSTSKQNANKI